MNADREIAEIAEIAEIGKSKISPVMNTDHTDLRKEGRYLLKPESSAIEALRPKSTEPYG
jgi:hypothetical protein